MKRRHALAFFGLFLCGVGIGGCGQEATPTGDSTPPPPPPVAPGTAIITNLSQSTGIPVAAGTKDYPSGAIEIEMGNQGGRLLSLRLIDRGNVYVGVDVMNVRIMVNGLPTNGVARIDRLHNAAHLDLTAMAVTLKLGKNTLVVYADYGSGVDGSSQLEITWVESIKIEDAAGNVVIPTLRKGAFPLQLSNIAIGPGTVTVGLALSFINESIVQAGPKKTLAVFHVTPDGETSKLQSFIVLIEVGGGLQASDITNIKIADDGGNTVLGSSPTINPDPKTPGILVMPAPSYLLQLWSQATLYITADIKAGGPAGGWIKASLQDIKTQGISSLMSATIPLVSGPQLTVVG
jgi:hypothetical protein